PAKVNSVNEIAQGPFGPWAHGIGPIYFFLGSSGGSGGFGSGGTTRKCHSCVVAVGLPVINPTSWPMGACTSGVVGPTTLAPSALVSSTLTFAFSLRNESSAFTCAALSV